MWLGSRNQAGYAKVWDGRRAVYAHRVSYEGAHGPIPDGQEIDHLCRNRPCVNPEHLEAVTHRVNTLRGDTITARNAAATHCPRGHPYSPENTRIRRGFRECRTCDPGRR